LAFLEPKEPPRRYPRQHPGELIHFDIKKLARFERVGGEGVGLLEQEVGMHPA